MFSHSWQLITQASYDRPDLLPQELWQRVHATANLGPFFVWATDDATRAAHANLLSRWISGYAETTATSSSTAPERSTMGSATSTATPTALPEAARDAAKRLNVPVTAAKALWDGRSAVG